MVLCAGPVHSIAALHFDCCSPAREAVVPTVAPRAFCPYLVGLDCAYYLMRQTLFMVSFFSTLSAVYLPWGLVLCIAYNGVMEVVFIGGGEKKQGMGH